MILSLLKIPNMKTHRESTQPRINLSSISRPPFVQPAASLYDTFSFKHSLSTLILPKPGVSFIFFIIMIALHISSGQCTTFSLTLQPNK